MFSEISYRMRFEPNDEGHLLSVSGQILTSQGLAGAGATGCERVLTTAIESSDVGHPIRFFRCVQSDAYPGTKWTDVHTRETANI